MTRDTYAKELIKAAEAAFHRNETPLCPHENCDERISVVQQSTFSTRSLFCRVHGRIFQEQEGGPFGKLDWDRAAARQLDAEAQANSDLEEDDSDEETLLG